WSQRTPAALPGILGGGPVRTIYDGASRRIVYANEHWTLEGMQSDLWQIDPTSTQDWQPIAFAGTSPHSLDGQLAIDPAHDRLFTFGSPDDRSDVFDLTLDGSSPWTRVQACDNHSLGGETAAFLDPGGAGLVVSDQRSDPVLYEVRVGSSLTWQRLKEFEAGPRYREKPAMGFDPVQRQGVLFGGRVDGA